MVKDGKLYVLGVQDCIVSANKPVTSVWGEFLCGSENAKDIAKHKAKQYLWDMKDSKFEAACSINLAKSGDEPFQGHKPCTLETFIKHLEDQNFHNFSIECHNLKEVKEKGSEVHSWSISNSEDCLFLARPMPAKGKVDKWNLGSKMSFAEWDFPNLTHKLGRLRLLPGICFKEECNQIIPVKPIIYLKHPVKVKKDQFVLLG
jgi:hypothetical protein